MACTGQMDSQVLQRMQISGSIRCCLITADAAGAFMGGLRGGVLGSVFLGAWLVSGCCFCLVAALVFALSSGFVPLASAFALAWRRAPRCARLRSCPPPACGRLLLYLTAPATPRRARGYSRREKGQIPLLRQGRLSGARASNPGCGGAGFAGSLASPLEGRSGRTKWASDGGGPCSASSPLHPPAAGPGGGGGGGGGGSPARAPPPAHAPEARGGGGESPRAGQGGVPSQAKRTY